MSTALPRLFLIRHGNTDWADTKRHTGRSDLPLNARGEERVKVLASRLVGMTFSKVYTSPLKRAFRTCEIANPSGPAEIDPDLMEWDYGSFDGKTSPEIRAIQPDWNLFIHGGPGGESPEQIGARADRFIAKVRTGTGDIAAFSSGHISRVIAARWLGLEPRMAQLFQCATTSVNILGFDHNSLNEPVIVLWNDDGSMGRGVS
jgi:probable phosphoglycerate mutase